MLCYLYHWRLDLFQFSLIFVNADRVGSVFLFLDHMFLSELFFGNLTHKLIYLCFALYVSQVSDSTIIVIWKCIEFALLTIDLLSFKRTILIALRFCMFWYISRSISYFVVIVWQDWTSSSSLIGASLSIFLETLFR